jgi:MYND finger
VALVGLSNEGLNGKLGRIEEIGADSHLVEIFGDHNEKVRIKPENLVHACALQGCHKPGARNACSKCKFAVYCDVACQRAHWTQHKMICSKISEDQGPPPRIEKSIPDHPSWGRLTSHQRSNILKWHKTSDGGFMQPWPISFETDAMLNGTPCFLQIHPRMKFFVHSIELPSVAMYNDEDPGCVLNGLRFPGGRKMFQLTETTNPHFPDGNHLTKGDLTKAYFGSVVPLHAPSVYRYIVIAEVVYTPLCQHSLGEHYGTGLHFAWPGEEAIGLCPGTGVNVQPDSTSRHILVAFNMMGTQRVEGDHFIACYRIVPRILTIAGYERMVAENERQAVDIGAHTTRDNATIHPHPFYPDVVRAMTRRLISDNPLAPSVLLGGISGVFEPLEPPLTAEQAWEKFLTSALYFAWVRWLRHNP